MSTTAAAAHAAVRPNALAPLPLGAIEPRGWLASELRAQADGLTGHLDEFWPSIRDSAWVGGPGDAWERGPYWLDGLIPLAVQLRDERLLAKARRWIDHILATQASDGWLGPDARDPAASPERDPWPRFVVLKALAQWHEATDDARVLTAMRRGCDALDAHLARRPLADWARPRWCDLAWAALWLNERAPDAKLVALAARARAQGLDWTAWGERFEYRGKITQEVLDGFAREARGVWLNDRFSGTHGVNVAMGLKAPAVAWRLGGDARDRAGVATMLARLDEAHGQAAGVWSCDEHLAGTSPAQGTEVCTVVEAMFSLAVAYAAFADGALADRLERIAYNALPAGISPDHWTHQYDSQANQVRCAVCGDRVYTNNGADANLFGLEPNFGCCTANLHQGWPKFTAHLWLRAADGGLASLSYAPCALRTTVDGAPVELTVDGGYPFAEDVAIRVRCAEPTPVHLRIPAWADGATIAVDGGAATPAAAGASHRVIVAPGEHALTLRLPMPLTVERRFRGAASVGRGPLRFALRVGGEWKRLRGVDPAPDFEVLPTTPWNYALDLAGGVAQALVVAACAPGDRPFTPDGAPIRLRGRGRRLPQWGLERGAAAPPPASPATSAEPLEPIELVPYACATLRVAEMPVLG